MLNAKDLELQAAKGISEKQIEEQLACFVKGFPFLEITASASVERGIMVIPQEKQATYMDAWDAYLAKNKKILQMIFYMLLPQVCHHVLFWKNIEHMEDKMGHVSYKAIC